MSVHAYATWFWTITFLLFCNGAITSGQETATGPAEIGALRKMLQTDATARQCGDAYRVLLKSGRAESHLHDPNDSIAIHAAWSQLLRAVPIPEPANAFFEMDRAVWPGPVFVGIIEPEGLSRFLGFVEGRMKVDIPKWWEWCLRRNAITGNRHLQFVGFLPPFANERTRILPSRTVRLSGTTLTIYSSIKKITAEGNTLLIEDGDRPCKFSMNRLPQLDVENANCAMAIGKRHIYIAVFDIVPNEFGMYCIERDTGTLAWRTNVWALDLSTHTPGGTTGPADHVAFITVKDGTAFVWGGDGQGMYVESFDDKGKAVLRFSTNFWSTSNTISFRDGIGKRRLQE